MSLFQKLLMVAAGIFFILTTYGLFNFNVYLIILFFLLHSLCLILFAYRTYAEVHDAEMDSATYQQDIGRELADKNEELSRLRASIEENESSLVDVSREKEALTLENEELRKTIDSLREQNEKLEKEKAKLDTAEANVKGLLPPMSSGYLKNTTVNIIELANRAKDELEDSAREANLHVSISSPVDTLLVKADPNRLTIMFKNIIDNSIKYMKKAGALVITISTINDDIFIVLKDTGEGLPEDETKHIFELNYQGSNRLSGNGLGLSQARAIVEYYGGTIYAKSTQGKGMGIYIQLPA